MDELNEKLNSIVQEAVDAAGARVVNDLKEHYEWVTAMNADYKFSLEQITIRSDALGHIIDPSEEQIRLHEFKWDL